MVWNVDGQLENPNESRPSDPILTNMARALNSEPPVGRFPDEPEDVDVKKENLRKIQDIVKQLDSDIKYCNTKENALQNACHRLKEELAKTEERIEETVAERIALANTRSAIAQAMYNLDPQDKDEDTDELPASFGRDPRY